jgi:hypothetical protein
VVVAIATGAIPLAQAVINVQQDADDLPRLGGTAAEYQARLLRTETIARAGDAGTRVQADPRGAECHRNVPARYAQGWGPASR